MTYVLTETHIIQMHIGIPQTGNRYVFMQMKSIYLSVGSRPPVGGQAATALNAEMNTLLYVET